MKNVAGYLTKQLVKKKLIELSQQEYYHYGLELLVGKVVNFSALLLLAVSMKMIVPSVWFLGFFLILRGRTGGYHASTEMRCFIGTIGIYVITVRYVLPVLIERKWIVFLCLGAVVFIILKWAPVNHPNIAFSKEEVSQYKKRARRVLNFELIIMIILWLFGVEADIYISAGLGMTACAFLVVIAKIIGQEVKENEKWKEEFVEGSKKGG